MMRPADQADKTAASTADGLVGRCHCGGVEFRVPAETDFASAKRCDCSYCRRRWAPKASVAEDRLEILKGRELLSCYGFHPCGGTLFLFTLRQLHLPSPPD